MPLRLLSLCGLFVIQSDEDFAPPEDSSSGDDSGDTPSFTSGDEQHDDSDSDDDKEEEEEEAEVGFRWTMVIFPPLVDCKIEF